MTRSPTPSSFITDSAPAPDQVADTAPSRGILALSGPLVVSFWMRSLFTLVDTIYAATLGDAAVAAVGLSVPLEFLMIACWVGVSTGLTSTLSRAMGAGDEERIAKLLAAARRVVAMMIPLFATLGVGVYFAAPYMKLDPEVARQFGIYAGVLVAGSSVSSFWSIIPDSVVKAHHDTRSTMWAGIWSNMINVILNTIFTFVFHWGVFGIALSTVLGRFGGLTYALRRSSLLEQARLRRSGRDPAPVGGALPYRAILALAVPSVATYALVAMESTLVNSLLATLVDATEAIAAYSIYFRIMLLSLMPILAVSVAMLPYVARRYGEGDVPGIRRGLREAALASVAYCVLLVAPALVLGAPLIARAMAESELTARYTQMALRACPLACLVAIPFFLVRPVFEGIQRGRPGLIVALLRYAVLTAPLALAGSWAARQLGWPGFMGLLSGLIAAAAISSAIMVSWIRSVLRDADAEVSVAPASPSGL